MSVFNGQRFLTEAIDSILNQSLQDFEFVIIDDGSTDNSGQILDSYQNSDSRVAIYHQQNYGLTASLNRGCALSRGEYIARMDADDVALRDRLMRQVEFMENHPRIAVLGGAVECIDGTGKSLFRYRFPLRDDEIKIALRRGDCPLAHPAVLMRRNALASLAGYREAMVHAEDYDLWLRVADRFELANLETVLLKYRVHPNQLSIRKWRQQALSNLAARSAAILRRNGKPDPFDSGSEITLELLARLGVSAAKLQTTVARGCLSFISSMCDAGEYKVAFEGISEIYRSCELELVDTPEIADLHLLTSRLYWRQRRFARSMLSVGKALIARPKILGRPVKPLMRRLRLADAQGTITSKF
jgi:glycosyltransferase involved in cell wall biosynthesis